MGGEWRETSLIELGRVVTGKTPPSSRQDYFGGDIPFVTPTDFDGRRIIDTTGRYLTDQGADSVARACIPAQAVMVSCIGSDLGKAAVAGRNCVTNQQINSLVVEPDNDPLFVYYNLSTRKAEIRAAAGGSAQPILNKSGFGQLGIVLPPLLEQRAIAYILGTLDDKIELNRRMSETLEAMARALFKSWFVDFDPVRAKAEGRAPGLPKHLADLFPDRLVDSELGEIPEGWEVGLLKDLVQHVRKKDDPQESPDALFHHFSIPAYDEGRQPKLDLGASIKSTKWRVPPRTVLVSKLNPEIERVWMVDVKDGQRAVCSTEFLVLEPSPPFTAAYVYCLARSVVFRQQLEGLVTGTSKSHQRARPAAVLALPVLAPPPPVLSAFDAISAQWFRRVSVAVSESESLVALRDTLLPKLVSGELRLDDPDRFLERAAS